MKLKNVNVSGIGRIVFVNQNVLWKRLDGLCEGDPPHWIKCEDAKVAEIRPHEWAVRTIKFFSDRGAAYVWISGDTVNIRYPL